MNKQEQKKLLIEIMQADEKDGLYSDISKMETTQTDDNKMKSTQTAVEWLYDRFLFAGYAIPSEWKEQAKQIENKQRIKDYNVGYTDAQCNHINDAENYVNEQEYLNDDPEIKGWTIGPFGTPEKL
jgi:hypothetical protein